MDIAVNLPGGVKLLPGEWLGAHTHHLCPAWSPRCIFIYRVHLALHPERLCSEASATGGGGGVGGDGEIARLIIIEVSNVHWSRFAALFYVPCFRPSFPSD